ncbi:hypothetical protein ACFFX0_09515 [Citricoccus parietis]|uniref:Uncharacterized protein n=1 Tax=Citricoccus parietis TaxID=592307 RepID=A0ABV5FXL0_9MICC
MAAPAVSKAENASNSSARNASTTALTQVRQPAGLRPFLSTGANSLTAARKARTEGRSGRARSARASTAIVCAIAGSRETSSNSWALE